MSFGIIALVVVFQPDLRRALEQVGRTSLFGMQLFKGKADPGDLRAKWQKMCIRDSLWGFPSPFTGWVLCSQGSSFPAVRTMQATSSKGFKTRTSGRSFWRCV